MKIKIIELKCEKCGHKWIPKIEDVRQCPKCKSARWDEKCPFKIKLIEKHKNNLILTGDFERVLRDVYGDD